MKKKAIKLKYGGVLSMKNFPNEHIYYLQSLLTSLAISIYYIDQTNIIFKIFILNFLVFTITNHFAWKKVKISFEKIYGKENHFNSSEQKHRFGGIQLSTRDNSGLRDFFLDNSFMENKKIKSYLTSFILYIFYVLLNIWIIPIQHISQFQVSIAAILLILLQKINFWGAYLLYTCLSLILFCLNINLTNELSYLFFLFFSGLFFIQFKELTRWYWINIAKEKEKQKPFNLKGIKELTSIILIFSLVFIFTDFNLSKKSSLYSLLINKLLKSNQTDVIKNKLIKQISSFNNDQISNGQLKEQMSALKIEITKLNNKKKLTKEEQTLLFKYLRKHLELKGKSKEDEIAVLLNQAQASTKADNTRADQILQTIDFKNLKNLKAPQIKDLVDSIKETNKLISELNTNGKASDGFIIKKQELTKKKLRLSHELAHKVKTSSKVDLKEAKLLETTKKLRKLINKKITGATSEIIKKQNEISNNKTKQNIDPKKLISLIENEILKTTTNDKLTEAEKVITKDLLKERLQRENLTKLKNERYVIESERESIEKAKIEEKHEKTKVKKKKSFFEFLLYATTGLFLFNTLYSLFKRNKGYIKKEDLSPEQKNQLIKLLKEEKTKFGCFTDEINFKYKLFYQFIAISFYDPTYPPPPSLISLENSMVPPKDIRSVAHILSLFFNSVNYEGKKNFTKKEIRSFRSQYRTFKRHLSKVI
jgi:hypothetical protein